MAPTTPRSVQTREQREAAWDLVEQQRRKVLELARELGWPALDTRLGEIIPGHWCGGSPALMGYAVSDATPEQLAELELRLVMRRQIAALDYESEAS